MLSERTLAYAEEVTTAILGVDALWTRQQAESGNVPDSLSDRLVVLNMSSSHAPEDFHDAAGARQRLTDLREHAATLPERDRQRYYQQFCDSTIAFTHWLEGNLPFERQLPEFLHVPADPVDDRRIDELRGTLRRLLNQLGYSGDLPAQAAAWEARHRVPRDEVAGVLAELMSDAWDRTVELFDIPAPKSDGMQPVPETGVPYNARCDYERREVGINVDPILTRPALKHLAVHECYPGHYVQFKLGEVWYARGEATADMLLSVVNTASSCTFEGIADVGMQFIGWDDDDNDRVQSVMTRYRSAIGTRAAWQLHQLRWSPEQVRDALVRDALIGGEGWVDNRMRFLSAPERSALIWSYWWGEESVAPVWATVTPERRDDFFRFLYGRKHSPQSVRMFDDLDR